MGEGRVVRTNAPSTVLAGYGIALAQRIGQNLHGLVSRFTRPPATGIAARPDAARLAAILTRTESALADDILPFWTRETWDEDGGGFITHLDRTGRRSGPTGKFLMTQAGMIWALAAAHRHGLEDRGYLELARRGVGFLLEKMWDRDHGGFVWQVARDGHVIDPRKDTCGQAVAIYALTEYAMASGDEAALAKASAVFDLLHQRASDGPVGFRERFTRDWTPAPDPSGERKTLLAHLHLMTAFTLLAGATGASAHAAAAEKVLTLLLTLRRGTDTFDRSWRPLDLGFGRTVTSYGLNVEAAWLMLDTADAVGTRDRVCETALSPIDHALAYGFDRWRGGLARFGPPRGHVANAVYLGPRRLHKVWWVQAEFLVATIEAYRLTGAAVYLGAFEKQFDWIWTRQADRDAGSWFEATTRDGRPLGFGKGDAGRCPFHETRALIRVSRALHGMGIR
jgi:mannose/cellobiose epimerase-like protein (N-acyl-D-glucosamine 2-epimerase family)